MQLSLIYVTYNSWPDFNFTAVWWQLLIHVCVLNINTTLISICFPGKRRTDLHTVPRRFIGPATVMVLQATGFLKPFLFLCDFHKDIEKASVSQWSRSEVEWFMNKWLWVIYKCLSLPPLDQQCRAITNIEKQATASTSIDVTTALLLWKMKIPDRQHGLISCGCLRYRFWIVRQQTPIVIIAHNRSRVMP